MLADGGKAGKSLQSVYSSNMASLPGAASGFQDTLSLDVHAKQRAELLRAAAAQRWLTKHEVLEILSNYTAMGFTLSGAAAFRPAGAREWPKSTFNCIEDSLGKPFYQQALVSGVIVRNELVWVYFTGRWLASLV